MLPLTGINLLTCHDEPVAELVLGTAQFGTGYGVTNTKGRLSDAEVAAIMERAAAIGIVRVDTAAGYGDAQQRLRPYAAGLVVTSKVPGIDAQATEPAVRASLADLGIKTLDACLLHDWHTIDPADQSAAAEALEACRAEGLVGHVGISAYEESDLVTAMEAFDRLDVVQVPANALDRRLDGSPALGRLRAAGTRIQVRSAFLQGLLAGPSSTALGAHPAVEAFLADCAAGGRSPLAVALGHVRALPGVAEVVVGVTSAGELDAVWAAWQEPAALADPSSASDDLALLDPRRW